MSFLIKKHFSKAERSVTILNIKHSLQKMLQFSLDLCDDRRTLVGQGSVELDQGSASSDFIQGVLATGHTSDSNDGNRAWKTKISVTRCSGLVINDQEVQHYGGGGAPLVRLYISLTASVERCLSG